MLDIGCGLGGSALWLADQFDCEVTGITISPVQARMAAAKAKARGLAQLVQFQVQDANEWQPEPARVDMIRVMESGEHFHDKPLFFDRCALALKPGGVSQSATGFAAMDLCATTNRIWSTPSRRRRLALVWTRSATIKVGCAMPASRSSWHQTSRATLNRPGPTAPAWAAIPLSDFFFVSPAGPRNASCDRSR